MIHSTEQAFQSRIPSYVREGMDQLTKNGYEAYLVGGAVRDFLLGGAPADFDMATDATPEQMLEAYKEHSTIPTGMKHGTITVLIKGRPLEITTYRIDGAYSDQRRPDVVTYSRSLEEDVKRRDFTINALAMDASGRVLDYVGGKQDLARKIIRCVGDPNQRLQEDALRILRALRFSSVLGFPIEEETRRGLFDHKELLAKVSVERIWSEFSGMLCGTDADQILLHYSSILAVILPEILPMIGCNQHNPHHLYDVWEHTALVVRNTPPIIYLRLAAFLHDIGKPSSFSLDEEGIGHFYGHPQISSEIAHSALLRLKADTHTREQVEMLVLHHDMEIEPTERSVRRRLCQFGEATLRDLLVIKRADTIAQSEISQYRLAELAQVEAVLEGVLSDKACFSMKDLAIRGEDIIAAGVSRGPRVGAILQEILHQVVEGTVMNEKAQLLTLVTILHNSTPILFTNDLENGKKH